MPSEREHSGIGSRDGAALDGVVGARLLEAGQRYSPGRRRLVGVLGRALRPLTSPEIAAAEPALALSSVYRNLAVLVAAGVVRRLATHEDTAKYELAESLTRHHHHLICDRCGEVLDYEAPSGLEERLARAVEAVAEETGFRPRAHTMEILGLCGRCAGS